MAPLFSPAPRALRPGFASDLGERQWLSAAQANYLFEMFRGYWHADLVFVYHHGIAKAVMQGLFAVVKGGHQITDEENNLAE